MRIVRTVTRPKKPKRVTWAEVFSSPESKDLVRMRYRENADTVMLGFHLSMAMSLIFAWWGHATGMFVSMAFAGVFITARLVMQRWYLRWLKGQNA